MTGPFFIALVTDGRLIERSFGDCFDLNRDFNVPMGIYILEKRKWFRFGLVQSCYWRLVWIRRNWSAFIWFPVSILRVCVQLCRRWSFHWWVERLSIASHAKWIDVFHCYFLSFLYPNRCGHCFRSVSNAISLHGAVALLEISSPLCRESLEHSYLHYTVVVCSDRKRHWCAWNCVCDVLKLKCLSILSGFLLYQKETNSCETIYEFENRIYSFVNYINASVGLIFLYVRGNSGSILFTFCLTFSNISLSVVYRKQKCCTGAD